MFGIKIMSRKKYNKLIEDNNKLDSQLDRKIEYNNILLQQVSELNTKVSSLEYDLKRKSSNNINLEKQLSSIIDTNQKLNNWIEKILNEVGIQELHEKTGVTIPVYTENPIRAYDDHRFNNENFLKRNEIIIPELRFIKMG